MRQYQWVFFDNDSENATEVSSNRDMSGGVAIFGYRRIDNDSALQQLRISLIANGYTENSRICTYIEQLSSVRNPDSACWIRSDVAIRELGMDPIDCLSSHPMDWIREMLER